MSTKIPEALKSDVPQTTWGKILTATPVVMTIIATLLAGLSSSEMTRAQYDRSLAAQQQSKAGDQWGFFQAKRMRSALQQNTLDLLRATAEVRPLNLTSLKPMTEQLPPDAAKLKADAVALLDSASGQQSLKALQTGQMPMPVAEQATDPSLKATLDAIESQRPELEVMQLAGKVPDATVEAALRAAKERALSFDTAIRPASQAVELLERVFAVVPSATGSGTSVNRDFTAARLRFQASRYDAEARLNQGVASLYEVQVRRSNLSADRHRVRSERFFFGMLGAQAAVIVSTFAIAARKRSLLWTLAAVAGLAAIAFAVYVYLCV